MDGCVKPLGEHSAKIKGCFSWALQKSVLSVETRELLQASAAQKRFSNVWRVELGVALLWDTRVSVEVSGMDLFKAPGLFLSAVHQQMGSCTIKKK